MRFDSLQLPAFGPFTDHRLDFPPTGTDLHLLYGPNEAGKSSLLRAIRDLLYDIPTRSTDNFLHDHKDMLLAADLRSRDGRTLSIQRRKGNRNTLLAADGTALPDNTLDSWLGHVDRDYFTTMFGLASEQLREGAAALLRGEGDLGKALFSASLGGTPVHKIQEALTNDARKLFAGRARASIRASASSFSDALKLAKDHLIKPEDWETVERELAETLQRQSAIEARRSELQARNDWLQRCLDALPTLGRLHDKQQALAALPATPGVAASVVSEARAALQGQRQSQAEVQRLAQDVERLTKLLADCQPDEQVLAREAEIEMLHQGVSVYRDHLARIAKHQAELAALEPVLRAGMRDLGMAGELEALDALRVTTGEFAAVKELAVSVTTAMQQREASEAALQDKEASIATLQNRLAKLTTSDVAALRVVVAQSASAAEAARTLDVLEADVAKAWQAAKSQHQLLSGAPGIAETYALQLPAKAAASHMQSEKEELDRQQADAAKQLAEANTQLGKLRRELKALEQRGALPSSQDLLTARRQRETVWQQVVAAWKAGDSSPALIMAHEQAQQRSDDLADRLREHADQAAKADQLRLGIEVGDEQIAAVEKVIKANAQSQADWQSRWAALWQPTSLPVRPPAEMQEWREQWLAFRQRYEHWQSLSTSLTTRKATINDAEQQLRTVLADKAARSFIALLDEARRLIKKADTDEGARVTLEQQLGEAAQQIGSLRKQVEVAAAKVTATTRAWSERCRDLGLQPDVSPAIGIALIEQRRALVAQFDDWKSKQEAAIQLQQQAQAFEQSAARVFNSPVENAATQVMAMWQTLTEAREARSTQRKLTSDLGQLRDRLQAAEQTHAAAIARLEACLMPLSLSASQPLDPQLEALETRARLESERDHLRESLHGPARGEALDLFISKVLAEDRESLAIERRTLETQLGGLNAERDEVLRQVTQARTRQAGLQQASDTAAAHRQQAENHAARLRTDAARYLRLRLATHFLDQQIERFRTENQAPLMKRASTLFQSLTLGSFDGLTTDFDSNDQPVIVGHRGDSNVPVTGMSEGTRDQLYLSLRLAAIERHLESHEPLPLVLDDLLMTFDDQRAAALLPVLVQVAKKAQVLLFTHHGHLIDLCQRTLGAGDFTVHRLGVSAA